MFSFIFSLLIGALAGSIAGRIMGSETSALRNIVLGVPEEFWHRAYNMGGGESARTTGGPVRYRPRG